MKFWACSGHFWNILLTFFGLIWMYFVCSLYVLCMYFICTFQKYIQSTYVHMYFWKLHTNYIQTTYKLHTNFIENTYKNIQLQTEINQFQTKSLYTFTQVDQFQRFLGSIVLLAIGHPWYIIFLRCHPQPFAHM